ncbi:phospholipid phosphatase 5-like [Hyposmocoma kahamanoa]|uniref:phospholipid phosphatase 5-like n=1 Tax=Hyposmocoma kahamanoa TaxID=1477025 RepID=UPI000E6D5B9C|nr:phospholipid phosphatase 5-like [Hyposmocoma kahamanoa]
MWPSIQLRNVVTVLHDTPEIWSELLIRGVLLILVCLMHVNVPPYMYRLTSVDFDNYRRPRRDSIVPLWIMIAIVIVVPLMFFTYSAVVSRNYVDCTQCFLAWTLALSINAFITEIIKLAIGRPRPDFFYRCFPDGKMTEKLTCAKVTKDVIDGRKSFPSGHSSFSFCSMGFLSLWLYGRLGALKSGHERVLAVLACSVPLMLAAMVSISRCFDNHHHWEDVAAGSLIGFVSSYTCYALYYYPLRSDLSGYPCIVHEEDITQETRNSSTRQDSVEYENGRIQIKEIKA